LIRVVANSASGSAARKSPERNVIELYHARVGALSLPSAANKSSLEMLVSQKVHRAVGGSLRTVTAGRTRFRLARKFDGLRDDEVRDVIDWFEELPWQVETFEYRKECPGLEEMVSFSDCRIIGPPTATKHSYNDWELSLVVGFNVLPVDEHATGWSGHHASRGDAPFVTLEHGTAGTVNLTSPTPESSQEIDVNQSLIESPAGVERGWQRGPQYYRIARNFESLTNHELKLLIDWLEAIDWQGSTFTYRQSVPGQTSAVRTYYAGVRLWGIPKVTMVSQNIWDVQATFEFPQHPNLYNGS